MQSRTRTVAAFATLFLVVWQGQKHCCLGARDVPALDDSNGDAMGPDGERIFFQDPPKLEQKLDGEECLLGAFCPEDVPFCFREKKFQVKGVCVECRDTPDCPGAEICDPDTKTCQAPPPGPSPSPPSTPVTVEFVIGFTGFSVLQAFNEADEIKLCNNLNTLVAGGTCKIVGIIYGSAFVTGATVYPDATSAEQLNMLLTTQSQATLATLAQGLSVSDTKATVVSTKVTTDPDFTRSPKAPTGVGADQVNGTCPAAAEVTWQAPADDTILGYFISCMVQGDETILVDQLVGFQETMVVFQNLSAGMGYVCGVNSTSVGGTSAATVSSAFNITACELPGTPKSLETTFISPLSWSAVWIDGAEGFPAEEYVLKCVEAGADCNAPAEGTPESDIPRGAEAGTVTNLTEGAKYSCYAVASNSAGSVCSGGLNITTGVPPVRPIDVQTLNVGFQNWTASWEVGSSDRDNLTYEYALKCVGAGETCDSQGILLDGIPQETLTETLTGLESGGNYSCFVLAYNDVATLCSDPVSLLTKKKSTVAFSVRYSGGAVTVDTFTEQDQQQVCANLKSLVPPDSGQTLCNVTDILPGSVIAVGGVEFLEETTSGENDPPAEFVRTLNERSANVTDTLAANLSIPAQAEVEGSAEVVIVNPEDPDTVDPPPSPANVQVLDLSQTCPPTSTITWTNPTSNVTVLGYIIKCNVTGTGSSFVRTALGQTNITLTVDYPEAEYDCKIFSYSINAESVEVGIPKFSESACLLPGEPTDIQTDFVTMTAWSMTWADGSFGVPGEVYAVQCSALGGLCGEQNLEGRVCSSAFNLSTPAMPGVPSQLQTVSIGQEAWTGGWVDSQEGGTPDSYTLKCVATGGACQDQAIQQATGIAPGIQRARLQSLSEGTQYSCYIVAVIGTSEICSSPLSIVTWLLPAKPSAPVTSNIGTNIWRATWADGSQPGIPQETYTLQCASFGNSCEAASQGVAAAGIARGVQTGTITGLQTGTQYSCYAISVNAAGTVCSDSTVITTYEDPGVPTALKIASIGLTNVTVTWIDGAPGIPEEEYALRCMSKGVSCQGVPIAQTSRIPRGNQIATVEGLQPGKEYSCFVVAENLAAASCSDPLSIQTDQLPGQPTKLTTDGLTAQVSGVSPGTETAVLSGLQEGTNYTCYVVAVNEEGSVCSSPKDIETDSLPGQPTQVTTLDIGLTNWTVGWTDGTGGVPAETYTVKCAQPGSACGATAVAQVSGVSPGTETAVLSGLQEGTNYTCYVVAVNEEGSVCSSPKDLQTKSVPGVPVGLSTVSINETAWDGSWVESLVAANPEETYTLKCVLRNAGCFAPSQGLEETGILRGVESGTVVDLSPGTDYDCFAAAENEEGISCSDPFAITTLITLPPENVTVDQASSCVPSIVLSWNPPGGGVEVFEYNVTCVSEDAFLSEVVPSENSSFTFEIEPSVNYSCSIYSISSVGQSITLQLDPVAYTYPKVCTFQVTQLVSLDQYQIGSPSPWYRWLRDNAVAEIVASPSPSAKLETTCNGNDKVIIGFGDPIGLFEGMSLKDFFTDFKEVSFEFYKEVPDSDCGPPNNAAAPAIEIGIGNLPGGNSGFFKLEPTYILPSALIETDKWVNVTDLKADGYTTPLPIQDPSNIYSKGWWTFTNYGQCIGTGSSYLGNCRLSIEGWNTLFEEDPSLVGDAIINRLEFQLGSGNLGITSYVRSLRISVGEYDWSFEFGDVST
eukprot:jgi/Picsp_1/798/NSC_04287-R1_receptor tyrosine phosphatase type r2a